MRGAFRSHVRWLKRMGRKVDQGSQISQVSKVEVGATAETEPDSQSGLQPA